MGMVVRTNTMALNAYRQLGMNNSAVAKSLEKLSSGYRINRAGDDAAGLAISEKMKAQIKGLETASANAQDGISLIQTAEGNLSEVHDMLNRMVELATKSANGTYTTTERQALQDEMNQLLTEIDRISQSANFNGTRLLDGSLDPEATGVGATEGSTGTVSPFTIPGVGTVLGTDTIKHSSGVQARSTKFDVDLHEVVFNNGTGETLTLQIGDDTFTIEGNNNGEMSAADIATAFVAGTRVKDADANALTAGKATIGGSEFNVKVNANGTGITFELADGEAVIDGDMAVSVTGSGTAAVKAGWTTGAYTAAVAPDDAAGTGYVAANWNNDAKVDITLTIDGADVTFSKNDIAGAADADAIKTAIEGAAAANGKTIADYATVTKNADGTFKIEILDDLDDGAGNPVTATVKAFAFTADTGTAGTSGAAGTATPAKAAMGAGTVINATPEGAGSVKGHYNIQTTVTDSGTEAGERKIASTTVQMTAETFAEGNVLQIGDKRYTVTMDATKTDDANTKYLKLDGLDLSNAEGLKEAIDRLSVTAANNTVWTVGHGDTAGKVTFVEKVNADNKSYTELNTTNNKLNDGAFDLTKESGIKASLGIVTGIKEANAGTDGKALTLQIGDTADSFNKMSVAVKDMSAKGLGLEGLKETGIMTEDSASKAIDTIKTAINTVSSTRAGLGALQNRLEHTINNLDVAAENLSAANSRIRDTDMAKEMMNYTKMNVLVQSAQAMLAQANQQPQSVLQLLQ